MLMPLFLLTLVAVIISAPDAVAQTSAEFSAGEDATRIEGQISVTATSPTRTHSGPSTSRSNAAAEPRVRVDANDERIIYEYPDGSRLTLVNDDYRDYCHGTVGHTVCFGPYELPDPDRPRQAPPPPPASVIAEQTIINLPLPEPEPEIDPGYAITGLRAYLEMGNDVTHDFGAIDTVLGRLRVTATSTYTVDWGDGTTTGPHTNPGGPYPSGSITHLYQSTGQVDVTVTQNWTASWSLAGESGTVTGLVTTGVIDDFVVQQVQATRKR
jgi:hypothetical protein